VKNQRKLPPIKARAKGEQHPTTPLRYALKARLLAQEYIRNGLDLREAYATVNPTTARDSITAMSINTMMRGHMDDFVDELKTLITKSDIEMDGALSMLWEIMHASLLDYFGPDGKMLTIQQMKLLPRSLQRIIVKLDVRTKEVALKDSSGMPMVDDKGRPYLATEQWVRVEIPSKLEAIKQLALMMKWVGPETVINNNTYINVATIMSNADDRRRRLEKVYEAPATNVRSITGPVREDTA
jgi:hypothetical protein